jgi:E3 ubiquitin-protein ligase BAH
VDEIVLSPFSMALVATTAQLHIPRLTDNREGPILRQIEIPLTSDTEFFRLIQEDVANLDNLQTKEQKFMSDEIVELSKEVTVLAKPSKFSKTDMNRWRQIFDLYLQAGVFFSTNELDHGSRDSTVATRQLDWFQSEVDSRGLVKSFKLPASRQALQRFVQINITLLQNLKFQEINQKAIGKILKSKYTNPCA